MFITIIESLFKKYYSTSFSQVPKFVGLHLFKCLLMTSVVVRDFIHNMINRAINVMMNE